MHKTEQERFWAGEFGAEYARRNQGDRFIASAIQLFSRILARADVESVLELGANVGLNMRAIRALLPVAKLNAVEINPEAFKTLSTIHGVNAHLGSLLDYRGEPVDLAFTSGVLIHINPDELGRAYDALAHSSRRYVAIAEYYDCEAREIAYRGHSARMWKRDFCRDFLARHPDFALVDYGFIYRGDHRFLGEDMHWFLLERH